MKRKMRKNYSSKKIKYFNIMLKYFNTSFGDIIPPPPPEFCFYTNFLFFLNVGNSMKREENMNFFSDI